MKTIRLLNFLIFYIIIFYLAIYISIHDSFADQIAKNFEIKADKSLEWHQLDKKLKAYGNATIKNDEFLINANILNAYYSGDIQDGKILKIDAEENAMIQNKSSKIMADKIHYDFTKKTTEVFGQNIKLITSNFNLSSEKKLLYSENDGLIKSSGNVNAYYKDNLKINAEELKVFINDSGKVLNISAYNSVKIEINKNSQNITGDEAYLDNEKSTLKINGNVVLTQGSSKLKGDAAIVDIAKGISRVLSTSSKSVNGFIIN